MGICANYFNITHTAIAGKLCSKHLYNFIFLTEIYLLAILSRQKPCLLSTNYAEKMYVQSAEQKRQPLSTLVHQLPSLLTVASE